MPETSCLHIQARATDPVRVVDLPGGSVRIGRAAYCDVRLPDAGLADEECRLRRRGDAWQLVPVARNGALRVNGRPVDGPILLTTGASFFVGSHGLTLSPSVTTPPWADRPAPPPPLPTVAVDTPGTALAAIVTRSERQARDDATSSREQSQREAKRWESRWKAAGEKLRAAPSPAVPSSTPVRPGVEARVVRRPEPPASGDPSRRAGLLRDSVARRPDVRPASPADLRISSPPVTPVSSAAGYVPPVAPASRREPVRGTNWTRPDPVRRPTQPAPTRPKRPEPSNTLSTAADAPLPRIADSDPALAEPFTHEANEAAPSSPSHSWPDLLDMSRLEGESWSLEFGDASQVGRDELVEVEPSRPESQDVVESSLCEDAGPSQAEPFSTPEGDLGALLSRLQSQTPADVPAAATLADALAEAGEVRPAVAGAGVAVVEVEIEVLAATEPVDDVDHEQPSIEDEPVASRPILGAVRRGARVTALKPGTVLSAESLETITPEHTGPDTFRVGATRWVAHRPVPSDDDEAIVTPAGPSEVSSGGWVFQTPFVTDTNLGEPGEEEGPAPNVSATGPFHDAMGRRASSWRDGTEREPRASFSSRDWPSVSDILAAQGVRTQTATAASPRAQTVRPSPTVAKAPGHWRLPAWLVWVPGSALAVGVGVAGLAAASGWARDGYNAGVVAERLSASNPSKMPMPPGVTPAEGSWWTTTAAHLVQWAAHTDRGANDKAGTEEARALLQRASGVAPLNPTARFALARALPGETVPPALALARTLGQSRDVPSLAVAGRGLLAAGKKEAALGAFRAALEMAARADLTRTGVPAFVDDPQVSRYALPTEDLLSAVVHEMAGSDAWTYKEWASALPRGTAAAVVAARVLRESGSPDARSALDSALAEVEAVEGGDGAAEAMRLAARAEALAMKQRWADARDHYRQAVALMPVDVVRRAWWLNVADLASRLDDDADRQKALESAKVADLKDEITRRAVDLQRMSKAVARWPGGRMAVSPPTESEARR